jgi:hypothetical protein
MTKKRKIWLVSWALVIVIIGILSGGVGVLFPLVLFGLIELIRLFIIFTKRGKEKMKEQKEQFEKIKEQNKVAEKSNVSVEVSFQNDLTAHKKTMTTSETPAKKFIVTILTILFGPFRLITDPLFLAISNMDTATKISKAFGFKTTKCKYCGQYFSSINWACKKSPTKKHHE